MSTRAAPDRIDASRAALIVYDACRRALPPADPARRTSMRPVLDAWVALIGACRARAMPIIYTTPVSRADGADVVMLPTDLSAETGVPPLTRCRFQEDPAGRQFRSDHVVFRRDHAGIERVLAGDGKRQHPQQEHPSHVGLL